MNSPIAYRHHSGAHSNLKKKDWIIEIFRYAFHSHLFSNCSTNQQPFILTVNFKCAHNKTIERQTLVYHNFELHTLILCVISYNHDIFFCVCLDNEFSNGDESSNICKILYMRQFVLQQCTMCSDRARDHIFTVLTFSQILLIMIIHWTH